VPDVESWLGQKGVDINRSKVSFQGIADMFRRSWVLGTSGYCDSLKQSHKWSFGDTSDESTGMVAICEYTHRSVDICTFYQPALLALNCHCHLDIRNPGHTAQADQANQEDSADRSLYGMSLIQGHTGYREAKGRLFS